MEQPPHFKSVTPEQVHAARTKTYLAKPDLSLPPKSKGHLGTGKVTPYAAVHALLKGLRRSEMEH
jgi:hypothetical protein